MPDKIRLTTFRVDVTPPVGHPLCAGWMLPAVAVADRLYATGVVLTDGDQPVVLCAIDWCEISNESHFAFRCALARAVGTHPDRVVVHCMHSHCTPWPDAVAQELVSQQTGLRDVMSPVFFTEIVRRVAEAASGATARFIPITHLGAGAAKIDRVASNRRIIGKDGKATAVRWTKTPDAALRAEPEGLIDPVLRTISFWSGEWKVAAMHYYAVHPTSYDNDRGVTPDFTGLARQRMQDEHPDTRFLYFTGCAGNITAGKYNDGSVQNRALFTDRIYRAMEEAEGKSERVEIDRFEWRVENVTLPIRDDTTDEQLRAQLADVTESPKRRIRAALELSYRSRIDQAIPLTCLSFDDRIKILHLPGEAFVEYQLLAQRLSPSFVAVASYGDCGPGYICLERSFEEGGYEPLDSFVSGKAEAIMRDAITRLMA